MNPARSTPMTFSAVVGQQTAKDALILAAAQPLLAGVLLRGDKGSAKTTLARGLAALLPGHAPFVELPLGATEERVIGSLDLAELLTTGLPRFRPGLLAAAHGGVLYVDEINLLADHLIDALLDVAVSGVNRVERDGLSHTHPARFVLVGSMNPEEGELRPQLLDRFGLAVDVTATNVVASRTIAVRRQLDVESNDAMSSGREESSADHFNSADDVLRSVIARAGDAAVTISDEVIVVASALAVAVGAEGLRADLMLCRGAVARAAIDGRTTASIDDVRSVAEMVLGHRRRRRPFDEPGISPRELEQAWDEALLPQTPPREGHEPPDQIDRPASASNATLPRASANGRSRPRTGDREGGFENNDAVRGRFVRSSPFDASGRSGLDAHATAIAVAARRASTGDQLVAVDDLRSSEREQRRGNLVVFVVDASASMGVEHRMAATKAAIVGLLGDAYRRRGRVALITFRGDAAEVVLRPTASVEIARARLTDLATGGTTPLAAGLDAARGVLEVAAGGRAMDCHVVLVTDGRATAGVGDPVIASRLAASRLSPLTARFVVIDTETGATRLGLARELAESIEADYLHVDSLGTDGFEHAARNMMTP